MFSEITGISHRSLYSFETQDQSGSTVYHVIDMKHVSYASVREDDTHKNTDEYTLSIVVGGVLLEFNKLTYREAKIHCNNMLR